MVNYKPVPSVQSQFKDACEKTGGDYKETMSGRVLVCEQDPDTARGYQERRMVLDVEEGAETGADMEASIGTGGVGGDLDDVKSIKVEEPDEPENERAIDVTGKGATNDLVVKGTRGELTLHGSESRFTR